MYQATTTQELLEEQILSLIDMAHDMTQSDIQGAVQALAMQYELIEDKKLPDDAENKAWELAEVIYQNGEYIDNLQNYILLAWQADSQLMNDDIEQLEQE